MSVSIRRFPVTARSSTRSAMSATRRSASIPRTPITELYFTDTFDITERLAATAGGRYNVAKISVLDVMGSSPDLNSDSTFSRFNPVVGATYKIAPWITVYGSYSESNRAPTPLELGCSNPTKPCLLESFLVSDPPLQQVVGHTYEAGLRGTAPLWGGSLQWKAGLYRTDSDNDIINLASFIQGRGFFQNVPETRRQGVELSTEYKSDQWLVYGGYSFIDATYRFAARYRVAQQSDGRRQRKHPREFRRPHSRHSATSIQGRCGIPGHAGVESRRRHGRRRTAILRRRRCQPEPEAARLRGREPSHLLSVRPRTSRCLPW